MSERVPKVRLPRPGDRIVYYELADGSRELVAHPAIATGTLDPPDGAASAYMTVLYDDRPPEPKGFYHGVPYSAEPLPGCWGWPAR